MNEQLSLLDLLIEKHHKSVPIPIQYQHIFLYFNPNLYRGGGGGKFAHRQFFAKAQKRFALDC